MPSPHAMNDSARLRQRLDRAVLAGRVAWLLGWLGRVASVFASVVAVAAACDLVLGPLGFPGGRFAVAIVVILAAIVIWREWVGRWPTRLDAARAIEDARTELGERVSRAVEFLEWRADETAVDGDVSHGLRQLAVAQAAAAAASIDRLPVPGLVAQGRWIAAGTMTVAALVLSTQFLPRPWGQAVGRQVALLPAGPRTDEAGGPPAQPRERGTDEGRPSAATPPAVADAATRLAAVAAIEARLAAMLAARFAHAPGRMTESLPADEQRDLARMAAIQRDAAGDLRDACAVLEPFGTSLPAVRAALAELAALSERGALDAAVVEDSAEAVAANRLALAATDAARAARVLAAASAHLGMSAIDEERTLAALAPAESATHRRTMVELDAISQRPPIGGLMAATDARGTSAPAGAAATRPATGEQPSGRPDETAAGGGNVSTEPRFGSDEADVLRPDPTAARTPRDRVWSLLPPRSRPFAQRGADAGLPPEYKPAIDLYYTLLLESLTAEQADGRSSAGGRHP